MVMPLLDSARRTAGSARLGAAGHATPSLLEMLSSVSLAIPRSRIYLLLPRSFGSRGVCLEYVLNMKHHRGENERGREAREEGERVKGGEGERELAAIQATSRNSGPSRRLFQPVRERGKHDSLNC